MTKILKLFCLSLWRQFSDISTRLIHWLNRFKPTQCFNLILRQLSNNAGLQFSAALGRKWATDFHWNFWESSLTHCKFSIPQIWVMKKDCLRLQASQTVDEIIIHTLNTSHNKDKVRQCTLRGLSYLQALISSRTISWEGSIWE